MKINGVNISRDADGKDPQGLDAAIQQRLNDPSWDKSMSQIVCRDIRNETIRRRALSGVGIAAALTVLVGIGALYLRPAPSSSAASNDANEVGATIVTTHLADRANLQAFPYSDDADVSMVLDDSYEE